jgi:hypothetical protein
MASLESLAAFTALISIILALSLTASSIRHIVAFRVGRSAVESATATSTSTISSLSS